jgi:3-dehydroquinate synthase
MSILSPIEVPVALADRSYHVVIGPDLLSKTAQLIAPFCPHRRTVIITDQTVAALHLAALTASLDAGGIIHHEIILPPGEKTKSFANLEHVVDELIAHRIERGDVILALGGGVIGDLAGFAAAIVKRGMDFIQIPTTLLAQVDSSVGGKTAINSRHGKNLIGAFHQPRLVIADLDVLDTLPKREIMAGYAEIIKYGLIDDRDFFDWLEVNASALIAGDPQARMTAIAKSVAKKAEIVSQDERESGRRALLNLGHTFGHAFEAATGFGPDLLHGEAVALGLVMAFDYSAAQGLCPAGDAAAVRQHLDQLGFITKPSRVKGGPFPADFLMNAMAQDKKVEAGRLTFILARAIGQAFVAKNVPSAPVRDFLAGL